MPVIQVTLPPGYSPSAEERIVQRLADAVRSVIAASASDYLRFCSLLRRSLLGPKSHGLERHSLEF